MGIAEYIKPENIVLNIGPTSKAEIFKTLSSTFAISGMLDDSGVEELVRKLEERESMSTTGVGKGIAIPHASIDSIEETVIAVGVAPEGVDFSSVDGKPATVIFMIIGSKSVPHQHIQILAKIVRLCKKEELMKKIRGGSSAEEVLDAIRMLDN